MGRLSSRTLALKSPHGKIISCLLQFATMPQFKMSSLGQLKVKLFLIINVLTPLSFLVQRHAQSKSYPQGKCPTFSRLLCGNPSYDMAFVKQRRQIRPERPQIRQGDVSFIHTSSVLLHKDHINKWALFVLFCFVHQTNTWTLDDVMSFLESFARWNPSQDLKDNRTDLMKRLMHCFRQQIMKTEIAVGSKTDQAVNAIWAAMVYHTPALNSALQAYGNTGL